MCLQATDGAAQAAQPAWSEATPRSQPAATASVDTGAAAGTAAEIIYTQYYIQYSSTSISGAAKGRKKLPSYSFSPLLMSICMANPSQIPILHGERSRLDAFSL